MNAASYTSASTLPAKVIKHAHMVYEWGKFRPVHVQISPTNVCQLSCSFCSCANRAATEEMPLEQYIKIMGTLAAAGCRAVTITGGGEPTLHAEINRLLLYTESLGLEAGLVTNGLSLDRVHAESFRALTWARVSFSDDREYSTEFLNAILGAVVKGKGVDWAFSYVVTARPKYRNMAMIIELANQLKFTHVRLVADLLDLDDVPDMAYVRENLRGMGVDDRLVIYQGRKGYTHGAKKCLISLVKPVIDASGGWFPCCGVQYALEQSGLDFEKSMCMGTDVKAITRGQEAFDGSRCVRCYYDDYNQVLAAMANPVEHGAFL